MTADNELLDAYDRLYHRFMVLQRRLEELLHGPAHEQRLPSPHELRRLLERGDTRVDL